MRTGDVRRENATGLTFSEGENIDCQRSLLIRHWLKNLETSLLFRAHVKF